MNVRILLAASLTLALASATVFAQDAAPTDPAAPAADPAMASDSQPAAPMQHRHHSSKHHAMHHRHGHGHGHGHVAGDPAVIDHSGDHMAVTPTVSKVSIPPGG